LRGLTVPSEPAASWRVSYFLIVHAVAFVSVALLASYLSERVQVQTRELDLHQGAVARLQALNENIIESIHSGLITTDLAGRVNFMNRGGAEITGRAQDEVEGTTIEQVFGLERGFLESATEHLAARRRFRFERYYLAPNGERIFLGIAVSTLHDRTDQPLGYIFTFQDLTEVFAVEQQMRLKERMEALGQMAAGMAHELRNPLAAISGAVQYLKGDLKPSGETLELMDIILRESQRLDQAIRDFLTFARPGIFAPQRSDLVRLLEENLKLLRKSAEFRPSHRVETRFRSDELWCDIDPNRMKQVFWNLATNALKAMPDGGTLTIEAGASPAGDHLEICFADEGIGMDDHALEGYFQPFRSSFEEGTGLGAAIVYRLVEEHGGKIALESKPGEGTRVRIQLPAGIVEERAVGGMRR
jgi:two-component system sensor histidine kinase PilS (NtrC family)